MNQKVTILIHDVATGKLLHSFDLENICRECSVGWLGDEKRLFIGPFIVTEDGKVIPNAQPRVPRLLHTSLGLKPQQLSPSGRFAAFSDVRYKNYQPEEHVWAKDLQSGEEKELFMLPARTVPSSEPNVTLNVVGWVEKK